MTLTTLAPAALLLATLVLALVEAQGGAALLATWKDGEIRESFDASTRVSQLALAVMPSGPHGSLTVILSARWPGRARTTPLTEFELRVDVGLGVNPTFIRQPTMLVMVDPASDRTRVIDLTERLRIPPMGAGSAIDTGTVMISLVELIQMMRARVLTAEIFALPLTFSTDQIEALRRFGDRALAPPG
jgi:hypothetical protein